MLAVRPHAVRLILLIAFLVVQPASAEAQYEERRLSYGLSFGPGFKTSIVQRSNFRCGLWGEIAFGMYLAYKGSAPNSMTARLHAQLLRDDLYSPVGKNEAYILESVGVLVNPEVVIPLNNRYGDSRLDLLVGIGAQYSAGNALGMRNVNGFFGGNFLDELSDSLISARRSLIPFVTAGVGIKVHRRASITFRLRQDLQNSFYSGNEVTLYSSTGARTVKLSAQPTRLLIGFVVRLGKLPDEY